MREKVPSPWHQRRHHLQHHNNSDIIDKKHTSNVAGSCNSSHSNNTNTKININNSSSNNSSNSSNDYNNCCLLQPPYNHRWHQDYNHCKHHNNTIFFSETSKENIPAANDPVRQNGPHTAGTTAAEADITGRVVQQNVMIAGRYGQTHYCQTRRVCGKGGARIG